MGCDSRAWHAKLRMVDCTKGKERREREREKLQQQRRNAGRQRRVTIGLGSNLGSFSEVLEELSMFFLESIMIEEGLEEPNSSVDLEEPIAPR